MHNIIGVAGLSTCIGPNTALGCASQDVAYIGWASRMGLVPIYTPHRNAGGTPWCGER